MSIRFIYFDVDDTLLDHRHAERRALETLHRTFPEAFAHVPVHELQETYHRYNTRLWQQYAHGLISKATLRVARFEHLQDVFDLHHLPVEQLIETYMQAYARHWQWIPGAREAFLRVARHYPVGLLTNGFMEVQYAKLKRFPELRSHARSIVISEAVGAMKPHPDIFAHATAQAGVPPETILYVGDSLQSDVIGGIRAGWQVAWFTSAPTNHLPERAFAFRTWPELLSRLPELS